MHSPWSQKTYIRLCLDLMGGTLDNPEMLFLGYNPQIQLEQNFHLFSLNQLINFFDKQDVQIRAPVAGSMYVIYKFM